MFDLLKSSLGYELWIELKISKCQCFLLIKLRDSVST